jgi:hypothetical protein
VAAFLPTTVNEYDIDHWFNIEREGRYKWRQAQRNGRRMFRLDECMEWNSRGRSSRREEEEEVVEAGSRKRRKKGGGNVNGTGRGKGQLGIGGGARRTKQQAARYQRTRRVIRN